MQKPLGRIDSVAAAGTEDIPGLIPLVRARTMSLTVRVIFGASIDADATVYVYYSPDGNNWDSIAYTSFAITFTAGEPIQRTVLIDVPEHGHIKTKITNGSQSDTLNEVVEWYSIQAHPDFGGQSRGQIDTALVYD